LVDQRLEVLEFVRGGHYCDGVGLVEVKRGAEVEVSG
jgi:hypothetical protein